MTTTVIVEDSEITKVETQSSTTLVLNVETTTLVLNRDPSVYIRGETGPPGLSAYSVAVNNGFVGTELEWLESLKIQWDSTNW